MSTRLHTYLLSRLFWAVPVMVLVSLTVFGLVRLVPGGPAVTMLGADASPERLAAVRAAMGLDRPLYVQYATWLADLVRFDFGRSYVTDQPVAAAIARRLPVTLAMALSATVVAVAIALPAGVVGAVRHDTVWDHAALAFGLLGVSIPNFWLGLVLVLVFGVHLGWVPVVGYVSPLEEPVAGLRSLVLPAVTLGTAVAAVVTRMLRSELLEELGSDYLDAIRMKGTSELTVVRHATTNALVPVITVVGMQFGYLLGGSIVVEEVFSIPGLGRLLVSAIGSRDYLMLQGIVVVYTTLFVGVNLVVDVCYFALNPRVGDRP
jgi:peptide/nickel transport system permease protein